MAAFVSGACGASRVQRTKVCRGNVRMQAAPMPVDTSFVLADEVRELITNQLLERDFLDKIVAESGVEDPKFTGMMFMPMEYSEQTPRGCPREFERFLDDPRYLVVNVSQLILFGAGCFKPSRLCAIFEIDQDVAASQDNDPFSGFKEAVQAVTVEANSPDLDDEELDAMVI